MIDAQGPSLGIAFGGGAARGIYHVGVIRALQEAGIVPDAISGTSAGSLVAGAWAAGLDAAAIERMARSVSWGRDVIHFRRSFRRMVLATAGLMFKRWADVPPGPVDSSGIADYVNGAIGQKRFSAIKALVIVGTDIQSGDKLLFASPAVAPRLALRPPLAPVRADEVVDDPWELHYHPRDIIVPFEDVGRAIMGSSCFPGVFTSVPIDCPDVTGTVTRRLVNDGGLCEQVPVRPLRALGCRKVIAVHLGFMPLFRRVQSVLAVNMNCLQTIIKPQVAQSLRRADFVIYDPALEDTSLVRFDPGLVERAYQHTRELVPHIKKALELPQVSAAPVALQAP